MVGGNGGKHVDGWMAVCGIAFDLTWSIATRFWAPESPPIIVSSTLDQQMSSECLSAALMMVEVSRIQYQWTESGRRRVSVQKVNHGPPAVAPALLLSINTLKLILNSDFGILRIRLNRHTRSLPLPPGPDHMLNNYPDATDHTPR